MASSDVRDRLKRIVDELPEGDVLAAERYLEYLRDIGSEQAILGEVPLDDEPLTEEDVAEIEAARAELSAGRSRPWSVVRQELG